MSRNLLKKKKIRKDYEKRRNIMTGELKLIRKYTRKGYSVDFPKSRKITKQKIKK